MRVSFTLNFNQISIRDASEIHGIVRIANESCERQKNEQNEKNIRIVNPLTHFSLKRKSFSTKLLVERNDD